VHTSTDHMDVPAHTRVHHTDNRARTRVRNSKRLLGGLEPQWQQRDESTQLHAKRKFNLTRQATKRTDASSRLTIGHQSVLQRLGEVVDRDMIGAVEVRDRSRDADEAVKRTSGDVQSIRGAFEQAAPRRVQRRVLLELASCQLRIDACPRRSRALALASRQHAFSDHGRRFARRFLGERRDRDGVDIDDQIQSIA